MGDSEVNFDEKIIPHRLEGIDREDWLDELWRIFTEISVAGTITMSMLQTVVDELNIEGDDTYLERTIPKEKWGKITYQEFVQYLDDRSRAASDDLVETSSLVDDIHEAEAEVVESSGPLSTLKQKISTCWSETEVTPKVTLVAATASLMILVSVALIVGLAVVWNSTALNVEKDSVDLMHMAVESLIEDLEEEVFVDKASGLTQEATMIETWLTNFYQYDTLDQQSLIEDRILRTALAMKQKVSITFERSKDLVYDSAADLLASFLENTTLGDTLELLNESVVTPNLVPGFMITVPCTTSGSHPLKFTGGKVCVANNDTAQNDEIIRSATDDIVAINADAVSKGRSEVGTFVPLYHSTATTDLDLVETGAASTAAFYSVNESSIPRGMCTQDEMVALCDTFLKSVSRNATNSMYSWSNITFFENSSMFGAGYQLKVDVFILGIVEFHVSQLARFQASVAAMVNAFNKDRTTAQDEIALATINTDGQITFPFSNYKASAQCLEGVCEWPTMATQTVELLFSSGETKWEILPNYLPKATISVQKLAPEISMGLLIGLQVAEQRDRLAGQLATAMDTLNAQGRSQTTLHLLQMESIPSTRVFDSSEGCPSDTYCLPAKNDSNPSDLSYLTPTFRFDCIHCQAINKHFSEFGAITSRTQGGSDMVSVSDVIVRGRRTGADSVKYAGKTHIRSYSFLSNFSMTLVTSEREDVALREDRKYLAVGVGCSVAFLVVGVIILWYLFFNSFDLIEKDWAAYKNRIERERSKFSHLVKGLLPPHVAERLVGGNRILVDQVGGSAFIFIDLCGFTTESKNWQPKHVGRYVTYCFAVMEEVAQFHGVLKIRSVGDLFCAVAMRDNEKTKNDPNQHPTCRAMDTAGMLMSLFSSNYEHMPQLSKYFKDVFKDRLHDGRATVMPPLRIGIHSASVVGGAYSIGNASHYDFYGPGPAVANRLQQTASPGRIHVSHVIRDSIRQWGKRNVYTFDQQRKTIVRGQGTISSYFVKTMLLEIPTSITEPLGMRRATKRVDFTIKNPNRANSSFEASNNSQDHSSH